MTIKEAAAYAGYRSTSTLKRAAAAGELRTEQPAKARTLRLTTKEWVDAYLQLHAPPEGKSGKGHRGKPRKEEEHAAQVTPA
jgi:hypothetical protein